jgi:hypothetical protein
MTADERREELQERFDETTIRLEEGQRDMLLAATISDQPSLRLSDDLTIYVDHQCADHDGGFSDESLVMLTQWSDEGWNHTRIRVGDLTPTAQAALLPALQDGFDGLKGRLAMADVDLTGRELDDMMDIADDRRCAIVNTRGGVKVFVDVYYTDDIALADTDFVLLTSSEIPEEPTLIQVNELDPELAETLMRITNDATIPSDEDRPFDMNDDDNDLVW